MFIRPENDEDADAIHLVTQKAFAPMAYSNGTEGAIIRGLRADGDLTLSLVAEETGTIVGHIAFSPVSIGEISDNWYCLGPISVAPDRQGEGIGTKLIHAGLERLRTLGAKGCTLIGNPAYYSRLGFESDGQLDYGGLDRALIQRIVFKGSAPQGTIQHARAFEIEHSED